MYDYTELLRNNLNLVQSIVDFFTAEAVNKVKFEEIKSIALARAKKYS